MIDAKRPFPWPILSVLLLAVLVACAPAGPTGVQAEAQIAPPGGAARVWFIRQFELGESIGLAPQVYVNGAPLIGAVAGTAFTRDLPPGTYTFSVETCSRDTNQSQTLALAPGTQTFLEIQVLSSFTSPDCRASGTFYVRQILPQTAQFYLQQVTYLGPR